MPLDDLYIGPKRPLTILLREGEFDVLDRLTDKYETSRGAVIGALLREYETLDLAGKVPEAGRKGARSRRR